MDETPDTPKRPMLVEMYLDDQALGAKVVASLRSGYDAAVAAGAARERSEPVITPEQEQVIRSHLRAIDARETCPICDAGRWTVQLLWQLGLIARVCSRCGTCCRSFPNRWGSDSRNT